MQLVTDWLWSVILPVLLISAGVLYTVRLRGTPIIGIHKILRDTYGSLLRGADRHQHEIFASALAATMGTGNLVGTALAIKTGGAGAVFWMWISALLGMVLVSAENLLSAQFRSQSPDGTLTGGALAYLTHGLRTRLPAGMFAVFCIAAALGMGNLVQSSTIAQSTAAFGIPAPVTGILTAVCFGLVLFGGVSGIRKTAFRLMPLLCGLYLLGCTVLLCIHAAALPAALARIFREAFGFRAAGCGFTASLLLHSMHIGLMRGIFSNEAGLGSSGLLHMDADDKPQWKWAAAEVFADTVICCTATALVVLTAPNLHPEDSSAAQLLLQAFAGGIGKFAELFLAFCMICLAFATMIGWYPCGLSAFRFLFGHQNDAVFTALAILAAFCGALGSPEWLWCFCDLCNGCMALPNLYGMFRLNKRISAEQL